MSALTQMHTNKTFLYCDGAFIQGSSQSGYGLTVVKDNKIKHSEYKRLSETSSVRAELVAVQHALLWLKQFARKDEEYIVVSDCKEIVECMVGNSMRKKNLDLWSEIEMLSTQVKYKIAHIDKSKPIDKMHIDYNKKVDALAYKGATQIAEEYFL